MNIIELLKNLYTNKKCDWIIGLEDIYIQPFVIQKWLCMNDSIRVQTRWLDKYVFTLQNNPKMYLSLAWSIIPKSLNMPFVKYIKQQRDEEEFDFILTRVRKHLQLSDNDYNTNKTRLLKTITDDMETWFAAYGVPKKYWKKYYLNFNKIKEYGPKKPQPQTGLTAWGL